MATRLLRTGPAYPGDTSWKQEVETPYSQLPSVQTGTRNLELQSGNPIEIQRAGQTQAAGVGASGDDLQGVMDLLRRTQQFGQNKVYAGQREQVDRGMAPLPSDLSGMQLSSNQIQGFRRGEQAAVEPTIGGARDLVSESKALLEDYKRTQETKQKQASDFISSALESGGSAAIEELLMTSPELFKAAGYGTKEFQAILPGIKAMEAKKNAINPNTQLDNERSLLSLYTSNPIVKEFNEVQSRKLQVDNIIKSGTGGPADLALVYTFMKALDPSSVVRETEYETARKSGNIFHGIWAKFNGYFKEEGGFLPPNVQKEFQNLVNQSYKAREAQYANWRTKIGDIATRQGLNPENVAVDFSSFMAENGNGVEAETPTGTSTPPPKLTGPQLSQGILAAKAKGASKESVIQDLMDDGYKENLAKSVVEFNWNDSPFKIEKSTQRFTPKSSVDLVSKVQPKLSTNLKNRNLSFGVDIPDNLNIKIGAGAGVKNNNPGNLRNTDGSWMKFSTPQEGFKALTGYVERAKKGDHPRYNSGQTLYQFFSIYAPAADSNNPKSYAETVAKKLGISPNTKLGNINTFDLAKEIAMHESSTRIG